MYTLLRVRLISHEKVPNCFQVTVYKDETWEYYLISRTFFALLAPMRFIRKGKLNQLSRTRSIGISLNEQVDQLERSHISIASLYSQSIYCIVLSQSSAILPHCNFIWIFCCLCHCLWHFRNSIWICNSKMRV